MAITNKLITFNKLTSFETQLAQGNILDTSIVFIKDAKKIWTKGTYFDCSGGGSSIPVIDEIGSYFIETTSGTFNETQANVLKNKPAMFIAPVRTGAQSIPYILFSLQSLDTHPIYIGINDKTQYLLDYYLSDYGEFDITRKYSLYSNDLALKSDIPNTDDFATKDEIGYTTEFSVADIEAVYGRGITKPVNVQGLISAIEANKPIIIPTNITDASQVGGNAVTMAKMENDGFIYLNVIVPYLDGVHKEYFIQIKISTAQLIKSGSNGSITLKELVAKTDLKTINGESILGSGDIVVGGSEKEVVINVSNPLFVDSPMQPNKVYVYTNSNFTVNIQTFEQISSYDIYNIVFKWPEAGFAISSDVKFPNGEIPILADIEYDTLCELSIVGITMGNKRVYNAVLTPFKSV